MEQNVVSQEMAERALERSSLYALAAMPFNQRPTEQLVGELRSDKFMGALEQFAKSGGESTDLAEGYRLMYEYLISHKDADASALADEMGVDRTRLYRGISPDYGPTPPYETVWIAETDPNNAVFLSVREAYRAQQFAISEHAHERDDYLGIELDFMRILIERERAFWEANDKPSALAALASQKKFFGAHLGRWATRFADEALNEARTDFYRGHLVAFKGLMEEERVFLLNLEPNPEP